MAQANDGKAVWRDSGRYGDKELTLIVMEIGATLELTRQAKEQAAQGRFSQAAARLLKLASTPREIELLRWQGKPERVDAEKTVHLASHSMS